MRNVQPKKKKKDEDVSTYINKRCFYLINEKLQGIEESKMNCSKIFLKLHPCMIVFQKWMQCLFNREYEYTMI